MQLIFTEISSIILFGSYRALSAPKYALTIASFACPTSLSSRAFFPSLFIWAYLIIFYSLHMTERISCVILN
jgi:hypothetical protein